MNFNGKFEIHSLKIKVKKNFDVKFKNFRMKFQTFLNRFV